MRSTEKAVVDAVLKARQAGMKIGDLLSVADDYETEELRQLFLRAKRETKELLHTLVEIDAAQQAALETGAGTLFEATRDEDDEEPETEELDYPGGPTVEEAIRHAADQSTANVRAFFGEGVNAIDGTVAYWAGVEAFHRGDDKQENPYGDGFEAEHDQWADGRADAEAFALGYNISVTGDPEDNNPFEADNALHDEWERGRQAGLAELEAKTAELQGAEVPEDEWNELDLEVWRTPLKHYSAAEVLVGRHADAVVAAALLSREQVLYGHVWGLQALRFHVAHDDAILAEVMAHLDEAQPVAQAGRATPELVIAMLSEGVEAREWQTSVQTWTPDDLQEVARYLWCLLESKRRLKQGHEGVEIPARPELLADVAIPLAVELHHLDEARQQREARAALDAVGEDAAEEVTAGAPVGSEDDPAAESTKEVEA